MRIAYDKAQICKNGHLINDSMEKFPQRNKDFCNICGEPTLNKCPKCSNDIKGAQYHIQEYGSSGIGRYNIPSFCDSCGAPFPWTNEKMEVAKELAFEIEGLSADEKQILSKSIDDIVKDTPRTELAATRIKTILAKAKGPSLSLFKEFLIKIGVEMALGIWR